MSQNVCQSYPAQDHTEISKMVCKQFTIPMHRFAIYLETTERKDLFRVTSKMPTFKKWKFFCDRPYKKKKKITLPKAVEKGSNLRRGCNQQFNNHWQAISCRKQWLLSNTCSHAHYDIPVKDRRAGFAGQPTKNVSNQTLNPVLRRETGLLF